MAWIDLREKRWFQTRNPNFLREHTSLSGKVGGHGVSRGKVDIPGLGSAVGTLARRGGGGGGGYEEVILVPRVSRIRAPNGKQTEHWECG